jgi:hypothetical protein
VSELRIVIFREADAWLAHGLEHDVGVQAENLKDLIARLGLVLGDAELLADVQALPPSPKYFQDLWRLRAGDFEPMQALPAPDGLTYVLGLVA